VKIFTMAVAAGPADIEATLLDKSGQALCSAFYVSVKREQNDEAVPRH
jgi:hypothetical protein